MIASCRAQGLCGEDAVEVENETRDRTFSHNIGGIDEDLWFLTGTINLDRPLDWIDQPSELDAVVNVLAHLVTEGADAVGTRTDLDHEFRCERRHELYERNYFGNHESIRFEALMLADLLRQSAKYKDFAERCMSEYNLDGWTAPDLINNLDVSIFSQKAQGV